MIQKRFQYHSSKEIQWTAWFNYTDDDAQLSRLQSEDKWQLKNKLLNEYRKNENKR